MLSEELRESYNSISEDYLNKKQYPWNDLERYLELINLPTSNSLLDIGTGNGRNLHLASANRYIALDLSTELLRGFVGPDEALIMAGALPCLPFRRNSIDMTWMIAVLHHFRQEEDVIASLQEMKRINETERAVISVWRKWRKQLREKLVKHIRKGKEIDHLINHERPWKGSQGKVKSHRFYHYYTFKELYYQLQDAGLQICHQAYLGGRSDDANIFVYTC